MLKAGSRLLLNDAAGGALASDDRGSTWKRVGAPLTNTFRGYGFEGRVFFEESCNSCKDTTLFYSNDGVAWKQATIPGFFDLPFFAVAKNTWVACIDRPAQCKVSVNDGQSWSGLPFPADLIALQSSAGRILKLTPRTIQRLEITSGTWEDVTPPGQSAVYPLNAGSDSLFVAETLTVSSASPSIGIQSMAITKDAGTTWSFHSPPPGVQITEDKLYLDGNMILAMSAPRPIYTFDQGATWGQLTFLPPNIGYGSGVADGRIFASVNKGATAALQVCTLPTPANARR